MRALLEGLLSMVVINPSLTHVVPILKPIQGPFSLLASAGMLMLPYVSYCMGVFIFCVCVFVFFVAY